MSTSALADEQATKDRYFQELSVALDACARR
jgi:hypothetical protein